MFDPFNYYSYGSSWIWMQRGCNLTSPGSDESVNGSGAGQQCNHGGQPTDEQVCAHIFSTLVGGVFYIFAVLLCLALCATFCGCTTSKSATSTEQHRIEHLMSRMDSVINTRQVVQQDSSWRELIMHQFQSIREKNDTSHTVVVDTAGRVIKETLIIRTEKESNSETDRQEREVMLHRLEMMDSTLSIMQQQLIHSDSLLQAKETVIEKPVEKKLSSWQQARLWLANAVLVAIAAAAAVFIFRKRAWWLSVLRRLFK